ncbi:MAG TPA: GNAT family N-acetyltransferase [Solirubrobacteraceae bacterium]|nr:GNAT family N-acetyltransferase [Solirubrobacteraceae bacterium]
MRVAVRGAEALAAWENFVNQVGAAAGFLQTPAWARINAAATGARPVVVEVRDDDGRLRAGALCSAGPVGRRILGRRSCVLTCGDGPVVPDGDAALLEKVLDGFAHAIADTRAAAVRLSGFPPASGWADQRELTRVFARRGYAVRRWATALVDLTVDPDEMQRRLHRAARKALRRADSCHVAARRCATREEFESLFVRPYAAWSGGDEGFAKRAFATWDNDDQRRYAFFVACVDGRPVATLGTYRHAGVATEVMSARAPDSDPSIPVQDQLHWHVLSEHRASGERLFDVAGFNPAPESPKEEGIARFKRKWGGVETEVAMFEFARPRRRLPGAS